MRQCPHTPWSPSGIPPATYSESNSSDPPQIWFFSINVSSYYTNEYSPMFPKHCRLVIECKCAISTQEEIICEQDMVLDVLGDDGSIEVTFHEYVFGTSVSYVRVAPLLLDPFSFRLPRTPFSRRTATQAADVAINTCRCETKNFARTYSTQYFPPRLPSFFHYSLLWTSTSYRVYRKTSVPRA